MLSISRILTAFLLICATLALSACTGQASKATYNVSGPDGINVIVRYRIPGGEEKQENVALPWKLEVSYTSGQQLELIADNTSRAGKIACSITLAGQTTPAATSEGEDQATCMVK
ncbi:MAG: MmpS family transport accessory protein [Roseiflexaceae bacterium]|nr:MmpS family transport accessory protein [Roseiflexaceae bacterium]